MGLFNGGIARMVAREYVKFLKLGGMTVSDIEDRTGANTNVDSFAFQNLFSVHPWSYAGIYAIASAAAGVPLKMYRKGKGSDQDEDDEIASHPFLDLVRNPNEFMTGYDLIELLFIFIESTGNSYWLLDNGDENPLPIDAVLKLNQIKEIWPIPPHMMKPMPDKATFLKGYFMKPTASAKGITFAPAEILHTMYANPLSMYDGQGGLQAAKGAITGDIYSEKFNTNFFKNGGIPPAFLKTDKTLVPEQIRELKEQWSQMYQGVKNAHKLAVLHSGLDLAVPNQSRKDMEFSLLQKEARERTLACLGVPPVMVGITDTATYNNAQTQKRLFWENTMLPKMRKVAAMLTKRLHQLGEKDDLYIAFDTDGVEALQVDMKLYAETAHIWFQCGVPRNELIRMFGPTGMEVPDDGIGGDTGFIPVHSMPIELAATVGGPEYTDPEGTPEDAPAPGKPPKKKPKDPGEVAQDANGTPETDQSEKGMASYKAAVQKRLDDVRWKSFMSKQSSHTNKLRAIVRKLFAVQRKKVLAKITEHYHVKSQPSVTIFLTNMPDDQKQWAKETRAIIEDTYAAFGAETVAEVGSGIDFDMESPRAIQFIEKRVFKFTYDVNQTTQERLRSLLEEQLSEGVSQSDLIAAVKSEFDFYETYRAARIARTEIGMAANGGIFEGYKQSGVETKRWISSRDAKVRDTHANADGEEVSVMDPFDVGGALMMHPGDPDGPIEEVANCRCTTRAIIDRSPS